MAMLTAPSPPAGLVGGRRRQPLAWDRIVALPKSRFSPVPVEELYRRSEEEIIAYAADAKRENALPEALLGIQLMLFLHDDRMSARVAMRIPKHLVHHRST